MKKILRSKDYLTSNNSSLIDCCIHKISLRDSDAFKELYNMTKSAVYGLALSYLKNSDDAEDVMHDVFIKIYEKADSYESDGKPLAWILTITKNMCLMKLRSQKNTTNIEELSEVLSDNDKVPVEDKMILDMIFKYISLEERNILMLHIVAGYKFREIAKLQDMPLSTVLAKYNRTIKKIKKLYQKGGIV
mgnify:FL=1